MIITSIDKYRYYGPLFEGVRIILKHMGEDYTPEYIQGISGAAFKIAGGCPSRPTCVFDMWTTDFIKYLGYEISEYPPTDDKGNDISDAMIEAIKKHIDGGKPVLVWNTFATAEWNVVSGYDNDSKLFIGKGTCRGKDDFAIEPWDKARNCDVAPALGAILINRKISELNKREAEINSLVNAVKHARKEVHAESGSIEFYKLEGIQSYKKWVDIYSHEGADRGVADAYCRDVYSSVRKAAVKYLRGIADGYGGQASEQLKKAADCFELEAKALDAAKPFITWSSPWGVDEERSKKVAPILKDAANNYEKAIVNIEEALKFLM